MTRCDFPMCDILTPLAEVRGIARADHKA